MIVSDITREDENFLCSLAVENLRYYLRTDVDRISTVKLRNTAADVIVYDEYFILVLGVTPIAYIKRASRALFDVHINSPDKCKLYASKVTAIFKQDYGEYFERSYKLREINRGE